MEWEGRWQKPQGPRKPGPKVWPHPKGKWEPQKIISRGMSLHSTPKLIEVVEKWRGHRLWPRRCEWDSDTDIFQL